MFFKFMAAGVIKLTKRTKKHHQHRRDDIGDKAKTDDGWHNVRATCTQNGRQGKIQTGHATQPNR